MRIGIFSDTYTPYINGVTTSVLILKAGLEKLGHKVFIITVNPTSMHLSLDETKTILRIPGIPTGIYDYRLTSIVQIKATKIIKDMNLDIIHSQTEFGIGTYARIISKQYKIPLVHTYHTMYEDYVHYITHGYFNKTSKKIVEYLTLFYCDKTINELIVPTKKTWELFKEKYGVSRNVYIVPTGMDIERFQIENNPQFNKKEYREKLGFTDKDFIILFIGRIGKEKNILFMLNNMQELLKKCPKAKLLIVGDGPELDEYNNYVIENKLTEYVHFTGKVPWDEVPGYYLLADIFVTPSTTETQGLTVIEAMSAGTPVVCINDESFTNTVVDKLNGRIFNNSEEYLKIIDELYHDNKELNRLRKGSLNSAELHSSKYFAEKILDVYNIAIKNYSKNIFPIIGKIKNGLNKLKNKDDE